MVALRLKIDFGNKGLLGPGKVRLLELIQKHGSIRGAAAAMDMSYRRAWLLLKELENIMGAPAIAPETGGAKGGGTTLTELGHKLVDKIPLHGTGALTDVFVLPDRYTADLLGLAALLGIVAVSALTYRVIERPGQRYFSALAARLMARQRRRTGDPGQILA